MCLYFDLPFLERGGGAWVRKNTFKAAHLGEGGVGLTHIKWNGLLPDFIP